MKLRRIEEKDNPILARIIRTNLKANELDIPGTAYFDKHLDRLSDYYLADERRFYYIATDEEDRIIGGIGLAELGFFDSCAELQKLYLADPAKGAGLGYRLIAAIEDKARELGYQRIYLETHSNLAAAIHIYEKSGYREIEKPAGVVHSAMDRFFIKNL
ncbi:MAG: GNAT family N-acetyltransferase [Lachnospiraceae bacterium]|nr:GNAT family N-acetyltransferase [Lachnospiraceae bacterium]